MDGLALLDEARAAGLEVQADGDRLVIRGPPRAEGMALRLLEHKAEVLPLVNPPTLREQPDNQPAGHAWDAEMAQLIRWFRSTEPPSEPFELERGVFISHPGRYWNYLREDIAAGPGRGRSYYGAFEANLRKLYELFGPEQARTTKRKEKTND